MKKILITLIVFMHLAGPLAASFCLVGCWNKTNHVARLTIATPEFRTVNGELKVTLRTGRESVSIPAQMKIEGEAMQLEGLEITLEKSLQSWDIASSAKQICIFNALDNSTIALDAHGEYYLVIENETAELIPAEDLGLYAIATQEPCLFSPASSGTCSPVAVAD